jgi:hypothetical protein
MRRCPWTLFGPSCQTSVGPGTDWDVANRFTSRATTNSMGICEIAAPIYQGEILGSVVWVSHEGHVARSLLMPPPPAGSVLPERIGLVPTGEFRARVVRGDGVPAERAIVMHAIYQGEQYPNLDAAPHWAEQQGAFLRSYQVDEDGFVTLHSAPGVKLVVGGGKRRDRRALDWRAPSAGHFSASADIHRERSRHGGTGRDDAHRRRSALGATARETRGSAWEGFCTRGHDMGARQDPGSCGGLLHLLA